MSGGGNDPISQIGDSINKGVQAVGNFYGFDNSGKWTNSGGVFHALDEGVGELTGRNQSRAALNLAKDQYNQSRTDANNLITQQQWNRQQSDMMASNTAGAARANPGGTGPNYSTTTPLGFGSGANPGGKDFLGL